MSGSIAVRAVIGRTFRIYVDQAPVLMPAAAVVFAVSGVLGTVLIASAPGLALVALIIGVLAQTLFTGMIVELVADLQDGRRDARVGELLRAVRPVLGRLVAVALAASLVVGLLLVVGIAAIVGLFVGTKLSAGKASGAAFGGAVALLLFVVPALYLQTVWSLAAPVVVLERPLGLRALRRSRQLVSGNSWRVFAVVLLLVILLGFAGIALSLAGRAAGGEALALVVRVILGILTAPITALAEAVLYFDLRAAHEHRDAEPPDGAGSFQAGPFPPAAP